MTTHTCSPCSSCWRHPPHHSCTQVGYSTGIDVYYTVALLLLLLSLQQQLHYYYYYCYYTTTTITTTTTATILLLLYYYYHYYYYTTTTTTTTHHSTFHIHTQNNTSTWPLTPAVLTLPLHSLWKPLPRSSSSMTAAISHPPRVVSSCIMVYTTV